MRGAFQRSTHSFFGPSLAGGGRNPAAPRVGRRQSPARSSHECRWHFPQARILPHAAAPRHARQIHSHYDKHHVRHCAESSLPFPASTVCPCPQCTPTVGRIAQPRGGGHGSPAVGFPSRRGGCLFGGRGVRTMGFDGGVLPLLFHTFGRRPHSYRVRHNSFGKGIMTTVSAGSLREGCLR